MLEQYLEAQYEQLIRMALAEDLGDRGDITSRATLPDNQPVTARIIAKASGILAGLPVAAAVFREVDPTVEFRLLRQDGDPVNPGDAVVELRGAAQSVLAGERTALNFLQRLSGVATQAAAFAAAVRGTKAVILDTRKTTPGWRLLEKYAVRMGGGQNHRIGLYDMVLVKDNHVDAAGGITAAVEAVRNLPDAAGLPIVVEVRNLDELAEALELPVQRILLDNMTEAQMRQAVEQVAGRIPLEASGNMTLERVRAVAETGVDFISVGALTHSAPVLDISMKVVRE